MYYPFLKEARALADSGGCRCVPVSRELLSGFITPIQALRVLRASNPSPYMFYFTSGRMELAGASPETLVKLEEAVQHREYPIFGVQFHPESILPPDGKAMLENFIHL